MSGEAPGTTGENQAGESQGGEGGGGVAWRPFVRGVDLVSIPLVLVAGALAASFHGLHGAISAVAGGALLLADLHVLAWLVAGAFVGRVSQRAVVYAALPFKFLALVALVYGAILVLRLEPLSFAGGITAVITAILVAALRRGAGSRAGTRG